MATTKQTFVYKTAPVPIRLDVYLPSAPPSDGQGLPLLVWFHGGGLLQGNRDSVAPHHLNGVTKHGYALISADYRLCPQVSVGEVLDGKQTSRMLGYNSHTVVQSFPCLHEPLSLCSNS